MLDLDRQVARERKLHLELIQSSMDELTMLKNDHFDLVIHPVSSCYLPSLKQVFSEIARVCRPGGLYMSQHKSPRSLQSSLQPNLDGRYELLFPECQSADNSGALPPAPPSRLREAGTDEFVHSLTDILGGICRAGFSIEDFLSQMKVIKRRFVAHLPIGPLFFHHISVSLLENMATEQLCNLSWYSRLLCRLKVVQA